MKLLFLGDFSYDYDHVAEDIIAAGEFARKNGAQVILNLEGPVTDGKGRRIRKRGKHLRQQGKCIEALKALGVAGVTLANNHIMDFSAAGLKDTITALDSAGIQHTGAGMDIKSALEPMIFTGNGEKAAVFSFGWDAEETVYAGRFRAGCAPRDNAKILKTVKEYTDSNPSDRVMICLHWGYEYNLYPQPRDIGLAHRLCGIDGVAAVIGHHSHCPQPFETYRGKTVFYSLGNFYYGSRRYKYSKRRFDHDPANMCDHCLAALIDTDGNTARPLNVYYDAEHDRTEIREDMGTFISMPEPDYRSEEYARLVTSHSLRDNPVLGLDERKNRREIRKYNLARFRRKYFGGILKLF